MWPDYPVYLESEEIILGTLVAVNIGDWPVGGVGLSLNQPPETAQGWSNQEAIGRRLGRGSEFSIRLEIVYYW